MADNTEAHITKLTLDVAGVLAILISVFNTLTASDTITQIGSVIIGLAGVSVLVANRVRPLVARYICCALVFAAGAAITIDRPFDSAMLAYFVSILIAGIMIGRRAVWLVGGLVLVYYIYVLVKSWGTISAVSDAITVMVAMSITILLMSVFPPSQRRLTEQAQRRAVELEAALAQLREKQAQEQQTGAAISRVIRELGAVSASQTSVAEEQVTALIEVLATIEQLSQAAEQISTDAREVDNYAEQALATVSTSQSAVNDNLQTMLQIRLQVQQIVARTLALNERVQRINDVVGTVSNIGAQTHLLALNAAIEAAGAGTQGERFATVAGEVKKLAQQTQQEVQRVGSLVTEVQQANSASVMATEQGLKDTDKGTERSRAAAESNAEVIEIVSAVSQRTKTITLATQQQRNASAQVVETMRHLRTSAQEVSTNASRINQAIRELSTLAAQLGQTSS